MRRLNPLPLLMHLVRLFSRCWLACRYYFSLNYSWHLAWVKAERI